MELIQGSDLDSSRQGELKRESSRLSPERDVEVGLKRQVIHELKWNILGSSDLYIACRWSFHGNCPPTLAANVGNNIVNQIVPWTEILRHIVFYAGSSLQLNVGEDLL